MIDRRRAEELAALCHTCRSAHAAPRHRLGRIMYHQCVISFVHNTSEEGNPVGADHYQLTVTANEGSRNYFHAALPQLRK
ncbi:MAG: hypothetical protein ACREPN_11215 [Rudaea sp.]